MRNIFLHAAILIAITSIQSCNTSQRDSEEEQVKQDTKRQIEEITDQAKKAIEERNKANAEKLLLIIENIDRYLPVKSTYNVRLLGGIYNGALFIENKTGYDLTEVKVEVNVLKAGGDVYSTMIMDFKNILDGNSLSKPIDETEGGSSVTAKVVMINGVELTGGNTIEIR